MAKFISFEARKFANRNGWQLVDISVITQRHLSTHAQF